MEWLRIRYHKGILFLFFFCWWLTLRRAARQHKQQKRPCTRGLRDRKPGARGIHGAFTRTQLVAEAAACVNPQITTQQTAHPRAAPQPRRTGHGQVEWSTPHIYHTAPLGKKQVEVEQLSRTFTSTSEPYDGQATTTSSSHMLCARPPHPKQGQLIRATNPTKL